MKSEFDREIDWLLRGQASEARRGGASSAHAAREAAGEQGSEGNGREPSALHAAQDAAHLDADEMNAYAENALPAEMRSLYSAHLADCDDCRHLVTNLALASAVSVEVERRDERSAVAGSRAGWGVWLASLLTPRSLAYASAALAVVIVGSIAFVALRQDSRENLVAEKREMQTREPGASVNEQQQAAESATTAMTVNTNTNTATVVSPEAEQSAANDALASPSAKTQQRANAPAVNPNAGAATATGSTGGAVNSSGTQNYAGTLANTPQEVARTTIPELEMRPAAPRHERAEAATADEVAKVAPRSVAPEDSEAGRSNAGARAAQDRSGGGVAERGAEAARQQTPPPASAPDDLHKMRRAPAARRARTESLRREGAAQGESETLAVGGRRFRRQGSAWIDTAYNSQATTVVRRHSEQFRALVADAPELRRIADQLDGEVVVIWKGRAYRIK